MANTSNLTPQEIAWGLEAARYQKAFVKTWKGISPQARMAGVMGLILAMGGLYYITISKAKNQIIALLTTTIVIGLIILTFGDPPEMLWASYAALAAGTSVWLYFMYKKYEQESQNTRFGLREYLCKPLGNSSDVCAADGTYGPYNGTQQFIYAPTYPDNVPKRRYIPGSEFSIADRNHFTYSFWLRVSYVDWRKPHFYGKNKPVMVKGGATGSGCPEIWLDPMSNTVKFAAATMGGVSSTPPYVETDFPMDQWVHYALSVSTHAIVLYKNGLLEATEIMQGTPMTTLAPLYIAQIPEMVNGRPYDTAAYAKLPGQLSFLVYYNRNLTAAEINTMYLAQRSVLSKLDMTGKALSDEKGDVVCPANCKKPKAPPTTQETDKTMKAKTSSLMGRLKSGMINLDLMPSATVPPGPPSPPATDPTDKKDKALTASSTDGGSLGDKLMAAF